MMWNPTMADEMVDAGCGWPYEPFAVSTEGGEDDPELDAPFEVRRYSELWSTITASGLGVCSVGVLPDERPGMAFGFAYMVGPAGCPGAKSTGTIDVGEFGTEAQRDLAAHVAAENGTAYVLGRWVVTLDGSATELGDTLVELGAQPVT